MKAKKVNINKNAKNIHHMHILKYDFFMFSSKKEYKPFFLESFSKLKANF